MGLCCIRGMEWKEKGDAKSGYAKKRVLVQWRGFFLYCRKVIFIKMRFIQSQLRRREVFFNCFIIVVPSSLLSRLLPHHLFYLILDPFRRLRQGQY